MAALDDELGLPEYEAGTIIGAPTAPAAVSALGGDEEPVDYGGGQDVYTGPSSSALLADPRVQARLSSPRIPEFARQRLAELMAQQQQKQAQAPVDYQAIMNDPVAMQRELQNGTELQFPSEPKEKPKEEAGWGDIFKRGIQRANEAVMQGKDIAEGKKPRESKTPRADYEDPLRIEDFGSPVLAAKKLWLSLAQSYPAVAAGIAGSMAGGAVGSAVPVVGTTVGGIVGGAAGMGLGSGFMAIGPAYQAEYQALGENPSKEAEDEAWNRAVTTALKETVVGGLSGGLFLAGKPAGNALKAILTPVVAGAEKPVAGVPLRMGIQAVGQPAITVGGQVAENVVRGDPLSTHLNEAAAAGIANVAPDVAMAIGGRALRRVVGGRTPGVTEEQKVALDAAAGQTPPVTQAPPSVGPGGTPLPGEQVPPGRRFGTPEPPPPPPPPPGGPGGADLGGGPAGPGGAGMPLPPRPPAGGPGGMPLPPEMPTPGGIPPEPPPPPRGPPGPGPGGTPLPEEPVPPIPPAPRPPGVGPGGTPLPEERPVPPPVVPLVEPTVPPGAGPGGTPLGPEPRPAGTTPERFEIGRPPGGEEPPPPPPPSGGGPRPQPFPPTERPAQQRPTRPEDFTIDTVERDHLDASQFVAKRGDEVIGKSASPEGALADARARRGEPYPEEAPLTGTTGDVFGGQERAPPAGTPKAEPAAQGGGDAVPKPPSEQTFRLPKTGHELTGKLGTGTVDPARPFVLSWTRNLLDAQGRPVRGATHTFHYADEASARADLAAVREAGGQNAMLREFSQDLSTARDITEGTPRTPAERRKATAQAKLAEVKAEAARPSAGMKVSELRRALDKDFGEDKKWVWTAKKAELAERYDRLKSEADASEAGHQAFLKEKGIELPEPKVAEAVTKTAEESVEKQPQGETVTKPAEELRTETRPKTETPLEAYEKVLKDWTAGRATKAQLDEAKAVYDQAIRDAEGTRTKSGAYVSPGEAAEAQAPRPAANVPSEFQQRLRKSAAKKIERGPGSSAEWMADTPPAREFPPPPENINTERQAGHVVENIIKGQKLEDAVEAFGSKEEGSVGRPRKVKSLSSFIRDFLKDADASTAEQQRKRAWDEASAKLRKLPPEPVPGEASLQRQAILDDVDKLLKQQEEIRANRAVLEDVLPKIEAIERGEPASPKSLGRTTAERQNLAERSNHPAVSDPLMDIVNQFPSNRFHTLLDAIIDNPAAQRLTPQLVELANMLKRRVPNIEVRDTSGTFEHAGQFNVADRAIDLNVDLFHRGESAAITLLHEGLHAPTVWYVHDIFRKPEALLTPRELAHKTALQAIVNEVRGILMSPEGRTHLTGMERFHLEYAISESETGGFHEIIPQFFTQPEVVAVLERTRPTTQLRSTLTNVGLGGRVTSLWNAFKNVVKDIFGFDNRHDSVLDIVMRPLTDIVDVGSRYSADKFNSVRRDIVNQNREVLGPENMRRETSLRRLATAAKDIADRGLIKTAMRVAYQSATTTAIRDFIKNDVPSAVTHFEHLRRITRASEEERERKVTTHGPNGEERTEPNINKARRLHRELTEGPDAIAVNKLMTDVTQAEMSVIDPRRNDHLTTREQIDAQRDLQARFDALDPRAKQTYREVNEYHNEIYRAEREAKVKSLVDLAFADRPEAEKQALREQMRTRQGVLDVLNNPDATPVARVLGQAWDNKKALVRLIAESQEGGFVDGDYFPSRRHGEYIVSAGEHGKPGYMVQMFDTQSAAGAFRTELMKTRNDVSQVFVKSQSRPRDLVSVAALATLDRAMERAGMTGDAAEVMRDMYAGVMIQQGTRAATRTMRREGIAGASVDQARNIMSDFLAYTSRIGYLMHGADAGRSLYQAEAEARALHQAGSGASEQRVANAQLGVEELRRRAVPADGDNSADIMGRGTRGLTTFTVLNTLIRPAHFFMQLAGTHSAATSLIAAKHGYLGSAAAVSRAFAQLSGTAGGAFKTNAMAAMRQELQAANWNLADMYRTRLKRQGSGIAADHADLLIDRLNQAGLINHTWIREIQRLAGPQGFGGGKFNVVSRFLDVAGAGEHALDSMMRVGTAKAAFEIEYARNGRHLNEALDYAMEMAERSQPDYNMHNKPRIATVGGSLGRLAPFTTQYRQFGLHMYGVQGNLLAEGVRGARGSAERREAYKAIAYLQASHALMWSGVGSAVFGSLPMMASLGLYDLLNPNDPTRRAHTNREMENYSRNMVREWTGSKTFADIFARGVPMGLLGIDVHRSLQFTNLLTPPELNSFNKPDVLSFLAQAITGASGDTAAGMVDGMGRIMDGDIKAETIAKMMPRIIRDPMEAVVWGQQGLKTGKGDLTIVPAEKFTTTDLLAKAAGFIPGVTSTARDVRADINLHELTRREITGSIIDRLVRAKTPAEQKAVREEIARYNASAEPSDRITGQQIQSRIREQARINAQPEHYGMRVPRSQYGKVDQLTAYARP